MTSLSYRGGLMPKQTFFNLDKEKQERIKYAAIDEFSTKVYEQVNLSDIIKKARIPRGSFYQYFDDKKDLYLYILDIIKETKLMYIGDLYQQSDLPLLDLVLELYKKGLIFAERHPKLVQIFEHLVHHKNDIYDEIISTAKEQTTSYFLTIIQRDQKTGRLRDDIDAKMLASMITNLTTNVTLDDFSSNSEHNIQEMENSIYLLVDILRRGIQKNGKDL